MPLAVLTSHGQPSDPQPPEANLAALAQKVAACLPGWEIRSATLSTPGQLESQITDDALIYPFFMTNGWFTTSVLPKRLGRSQARILQPFGLDPALPECAAAAVRRVVDQNGWSLQATQILLAAHGSGRGAKAAAAAYRFARTLAMALPGPQISCGFVEQPPSIATAATPLSPHSICLPFFAQAGDHVRDDVPTSLHSAGFQGQTLPVIGALTAIPRLIANALQQAALDVG